jgi:hypothetical protein
MPPAHRASYVPGTERTRQINASVFQTHQVANGDGASGRRLILSAGYVLYPAQEECG